MHVLALTHSVLHSCTLILCTFLHMHSVYILAHAFCAHTEAGPGPGPTEGSRQAADRQTDASKISRRDRTLWPRRDRAVTAPWPRRDQVPEAGGRRQGRERARLQRGQPLRPAGRHRPPPVRPLNRAGRAGTGRARRGRCAPCAWGCGVGDYNITGQGAGRAVWILPVEVAVDCCAWILLVNHCAKLQPYPGVEEHCGPNRGRACRMSVRNRSVKSKLVKSRLVRSKLVKCKLVRSRWLVKEPVDCCRVSIWDDILLKHCIVHLSDDCLFKPEERIWLLVKLELHIKYIRIQKYQCIAYWWNGQIPVKKKGISHHLPKHLLITGQSDLPVLLLSSKLQIQPILVVLCFMCWPILVALCFMSYVLAHTGGSLLHELPHPGGSLLYVLPVLLASKEQAGHSTVTILLVKVLGLLWTYVVFFALGASCVAGIQRAIWYWARIPHNRLSTLSLSCQHHDWHPDSNFANHRTTEPPGDMDLNWKIQ